MSRCCVKVRDSGMSFGHYHQCTRHAVTTGPLSTFSKKTGPVCQQHSPAAKAARKKKGDEAFERRHKLFLAYCHAKAKHQKK